MAQFITPQLLKFFIYVSFFFSTQFLSKKDGYLIFQVRVFGMKNKCDIFSIDYTFQHAGINIFYSIMYHGHNQLRGFNVEDCRYTLF